MPASDVCTQLSVETAQALAEACCADWEISLPTVGRPGRVLYRARGRGLRLPDFSGLREHGVSTVFILSDTTGEQQHRLETRFRDLMRRDELPAPAKAEVVHHVGQSLAGDLLVPPLSAEKLSRTDRFVEVLVERVLDNPAFAPYLAWMAAHHRSTASHMVIVSALAILLGSDVYDRDPVALRDLGLAGMLHDFGKLAVGREILNKPTRLTPEEMAVVQQHPVEGVRLLSADVHLSPAVWRMIVQHHERVDGRGYPLGLQGDEIDLGSRILTIVDTFHAITGPRAYRAPMTLREANDVLAMLAGRQFDAGLLARWNELCQLQRDLPPAERLVPGANPGEIEQATEHEHRPHTRSREACHDRAPRFACRDRTDALCVYVGRLPDVSSAPRRFVCPVQNLSRGGICLNTNDPLYRGEIVHVQIRSASTALWVEGVVAWCRRREDGAGFRCGVQFQSRLRENDVGRPAEVPCLAERKPVSPPD